MVLRMSTKARKRVNRVMRERVAAEKYGRKNVGRFSFSPFRRDELQKQFDRIWEEMDLGAKDLEGAVQRDGESGKVQL